MKILIIARGIPHSHDPQEGCFEWDQAKALARRGHEVVVMAVDSRVRKYWRTPGITSVSRDGVWGYKIFYFPTSIIRRLISVKLGYRIEAWLAKKLYKNLIERYHEFDIVHSHFLNCTYYGAEIKSDVSCRLIATEHWSKVKMYPRSKEIQFLGNASYHKVDTLISVSKQLGDTILEHFNKESLVIHNLINVANLTPALASTGNQAYTIVAVGSLIKIKGFDILLKAFAQSDLRDKKVIIKFFGKGEELNRLKHIAVENNIAEKIIFCGQKSKQEVYEELHKADLYVLSSRCENFSVALIEATANGLPAVATLCGGVEEYPIRNVVKVPVEDIDAMAKALEDSYTQRDRIDRKAIQEETLAYFAPDVIAEQLECVYNRVIN